MDIVLDESKYISSKRASEITGYAQDYIGQLSRKSLIDARRIGGLWYVSMESLLSYKNKSDDLKQKPPAVEEKTPQDTESFTNMDGKEYISANRASKITGYNQDYVGQLARGGKIPSRQVGNRWYVDKEALLAHKEEKDALLAAVQVQSVGIVQRHDPAEAEPKRPRFQDELLTYMTDEGDLIPTTGNEGLAEENDDTRTDEDHVVPIRVVESHPLKEKESRPQATPKKTYRPEEFAEQKPHEKTIHKAIIPAFALVVVFMVFIGFVAMEKRAANMMVANDTGVVENPAVQHMVTKSALVANASQMFETVISRLERVFTRELDYKRER